jgi:asparagine synthase (glutamine-hydrolysing)
MCGIAGLFSFSNEKINKPIINKFINDLSHRGPDGHNYWVSDNYDKLLVHTRLSIIDLSNKARQPFISSNGRYIIIFNGEIYNFQKIKDKLRNNIFKTNSDTEVLLYAYIKYGAECLSMFDGMFSFAIYDKLKKELFCARDPFGIKPFYYTFNESFFLFGSELNIFSNLNFFKKNINFRAVSSFLTSEYYENYKNTFYSNIYKIKPGHYIVIKNKKLNEIKYLDSLDIIKKKYFPKSIEEKKNLLFNLVESSIKKSLVSDVKLSIASSGGLDSSILAYIAQKNTNYKIETNSFYFEDSKYSEKKFVDKIGSIIQGNIKYIKITPELFSSNLKKIIKINQEPFAGLPIFSYYMCIKKCNTTKIILDGSGIDEAHFGYKKYLFDNSNFLLNAQDNTLSINKNIINKNFLRKFKNYDEDLPKKFKSTYKDQMYNDLFYIKLPRALRFRDRISMINGCELRPSYLDKDLISYLFNLEYNDHYNNGHQKYLLREVFKKYISRKLAYAEKRHVQTPQREWFRNNLKKLIDSKLKKTNLWDLNIFNKKLFIENYNLFLENKLNNSFFLWQFINLDEWININ